MSEHISRIKHGTKLLLLAVSISGGSVKAATEHKLFYKRDYSHNVSITVTGTEYQAFLKVTVSNGSANRWIRLGGLFLCPGSSRCQPLADNARRFRDPLSKCPAFEIGPGVVEEYTLRRSIWISPGPIKPPRPRYASVWHELRIMDAPVNSAGAKVCPVVRPPVKPPKDSEAEILQESCLAEWNWGSLLDANELPYRSSRGLISPSGGGCPSSF